MTVELTCLALAVLLAAGQLVLFAVPANREIGTGYLVGPRDAGIPELSARTGRLQRAYNNMIEGLVLFAAAVLVVSASGRSSAVTEGCAIAFVVARVAYVPCYWLGVRWGRSVVWTVGFGATVLMTIAALAAF